MSSPSEVRFDSEVQFGTGQLEHPAELYAEVSLAEPITGLDAVDASMISRYREEGFLAIEGAFDAHEVQEALDGIDDLVMGRYPDFKGIYFENKARDILDTLPLDRRLDAVRKFMNFVDHESRLHDLAYHPKLIAAVTRILGEEPVMFQDMALIKPPKIGREKPWHQDHAYFDLPIGTPVVGMWLALDEATVDNGCMRVLPGGHRDGPRLHFQRRDWQICDDTMTDCRPVAIPLRPGGLMLFDGLLPHGTPTNHSTSRRRALQFHYHPKSAKKSSTEERMAVFGSEGKNVAC